MKQLINNATKHLEKIRTDEGYAQRPYYPACIFYYGNQSSKHHKEIENDITKGWLGCVDYLKFYEIADSNCDQITDVKKGKKLDWNELLGQLTELSTGNDVFRDYGRMLMYFVIDTSDLCNADDFKKWYLALNKIVNRIPQDRSIDTMLIVILNESLNLADIAKSIKQEIKQIYYSDKIGRRNQHIYSSVFVLSNLCSSGSYVSLDPEDERYKNFNLLGDIILLSNTDGDDRASRMATLFGNEVGFKTAAYNYVEKPKKEIVSVTLDYIFSELQDFINDEDRNRVEIDDFKNALKIQDFVDSVYKKISVSDGFPNIDFIRYLPNEIDENMGYAAANQRTKGCLELFMQMNHFRVMKAQMDISKEAYKTAFLNNLVDNLTVLQMSDGISQDYLERIFDEAESVYAANTDCGISEIIASMIKKEIVKNIKETVNDSGEEAKEKAQKTLITFNKLYNEYQRVTSIITKRENVKTFYADKVKRYYSAPDKRKRLLRNVLKIGNSEDEIVQALSLELRFVFESDEDYRLSYYRELKTRIEAQGNETNAKEIVEEDFVKKLPSLICYSSTGADESMEKLMEVYIFSDDEDRELELQRLIRDLTGGHDGVVKTFYKSYDTNSAESLWFYDCRLNNPDV